MTVVQQKGLMITARWGSNLVTRDSSFFKKPPRTTDAEINLNDHNDSDNEESMNQTYSDCDHNSQIAKTEMLCERDINQIAKRLCIVIMKYRLKNKNKITHIHSTWSSKKKKKGEITYNSVKGQQLVSGSKSINKTLWILLVPWIHGHESLIKAIRIHPHK